MWCLYLALQIVFLTEYKIGRSLKLCVLAVLIFNSLTFFVRNNVILLMGPAANMHRMNVC